MTTSAPERNGLKAALAAPSKVEVTIKAPSFKTVQFKITGTAPLVVHKFSQKARHQIMQTQMEGQKARSKKVRKAKDFDEVYKEAFHVAEDGWYGVPASSFRSAMVSACRIVGYKMTLAKLALFIEHDGFDADEGTPLVRIHGTPRKHEACARNDNGSIDIRVRPMWREWTMNVRVRFDSDLLAVEDVTNLLARAGIQVGICEGRPDSKNSTGVGWGTFSIEGGV